EAGGTDVEYTWTPTDFMTLPYTITPEVKPTISQEYTLTVISNKGCGTAIDKVMVKVYEELFVPNAFSPNGDGINDTWLIETLEMYPGAELKVFNRFGQVVFNNQGKIIYWDGKLNGSPVSPGTYVYMINLKIDLPPVKGLLHLIR